MRHAEQVRSLERRITELRRERDQALAELERKAPRAGDEGLFPCPHCSGTGRVPVPETLGQRIRYMRESQGIGLIRFAALVQISKGYLSQIETRNCTPLVYIAYAIAEALGTTLPELLEGLEAPKRGEMEDQDGS